jgi:YVTN family beta-propeller protein
LNPAYWKKKLVTAQKTGPHKLRWIICGTSSASAIAALIAGFLFILASGCGSTPGMPGTPTPPPIRVSLSSNSATVEVGATVQFTATVANDPTNEGVNWSVSCSVSPCGIVSPTHTPSGAATTFTSPASQTAALTVILTATSVSDPTKSAVATITVPAVTISLSSTSATLMVGARAQFSATVTNDGANAGVTWIVSCPQAPCGTVSLVQTASGTPTTYTAPPALPSGILSVTLTATSVTDSAVVSSATVAVGIEIGDTVAVGTSPNALALDLTNNKIYVANLGDPGPTNLLCAGVPGSITEIDGASDSATTIYTGGENGPNPYAVALNQATNTIYLLSLAHVITDGECETFNPATLSGYNATTLADTGTIVSGFGPTFGGTFGPTSMAMDSANDTLYVENHCCGDILVVDGATNTLSGTIPVAVGVGWNLAVDSTRNKIYVTGDGLSIIDIATNAVTTLNDPNATNPTEAVAVNATTNKIYVCNSFSNNVSVFDGATNSVTTITDPNAINPSALAINETTNQIYVLNPGSNNVSVIDGETNSVTTVAAGTKPFAVDLDPITNFVYVANYGNPNTGDPGSVTVINGATNSTVTLTDPKATNPIAVAANSVTNTIYVANSGSNNVTVIEGAQ